MSKKIKRLINGLARRGFFNSLTDKTFLKLMFWVKLDKRLNLSTPETFNEKLQWLKLYDRKPIYTTMVDKYAVKKYVADIIGEGYIIPTLGVWNHFDEIDFDQLPEQFVLKCTHDSGGSVIVKNKTEFDRKTAKEKIEESLKKNYYWQWREWAYKNVPPRIIAEKYMEDTESGELRDYKFFCFEGKVKIVGVMFGRNNGKEGTRAAYFDKNYVLQPFRLAYDLPSIVPQKPKCFEQMIELAEILSRGLHHLRVDFYEVDTKIYFGELTFFSASGFTNFEPEEWDDKLGSWIHL